MPTRDPVLKRFGQDVREKREARRLSQEALAEQADLDRTYLGGIERGEGNPTILSALHVAIWKLVQDEVYDETEGRWSFRFGGDCGSCTTSANYLAHEYDGQVLGFYGFENEVAAITQCYSSGHDFAWISDRYIADYWVWRVARCTDTPVFDTFDRVDSEKVRYLYGIRSAWSVITDYTPPARFGH